MIANVANNLTALREHLTGFFDSNGGRSLLFFFAMWSGYFFYKGGAKEIGLVIIGGAWSSFLALLKPSNQ